MNVLTITLNPAVDIVYEIDKFHTGTNNRVLNSFYSPGGKGNNVARILQTGKKHDIYSMGFYGGNRGKWMVDSLISKGIKVVPVTAERENRQCIACVDSNSTTEILESDFEISRKEQEQFLKKLKHFLSSTEISYIIISGSFPKGTEITFLKQFLTTIKNNKIPYMVDTSDLRVNELLQYNPDWIKPNIHELEKITGSSCESLEEVIQGAVILQRKGVKNVLVSLGSNGLLMVNKDSVHRVKVPEVNVSSTVGAGDATVAGLISALLKPDTNIRDFLITAAAYGTAATQEFAAGEIDYNKIEKYKKQIQYYSERDR